jgi:hypothetical protein
MNPYAVIAGVLLLALTGWQSYRFGHRNASNECNANAAAGLITIEGAEDRRDENIDAIGQGASDAAATAYADTKGAADASADIIRTVYVSAPCRDVPAVVVQEHGDAVERINAKIRGGLRPGAAERDRPGTEDGTGKVGMGRDPARAVRVGGR